jgi:hypothetical protein
MAKEMACNSTLIQLLSVQHGHGEPLVLVLSLVMPEISDASIGLRTNL